MLRTVVVVVVLVVLVVVVLVVGIGVFNKSIDISKRQHSSSGNSTLRNLVKSSHKDSPCVISEQSSFSPEYFTQQRSIFSRHGSGGSQLGKHFTPGGVQNAQGSQFGSAVLQVQGIN
jgi:hypothetical protein